MFDERTQRLIGHYVYMLVDPLCKSPFYVGVGQNNRVFDHIAMAAYLIDSVGDRYEKIRDIQSRATDNQVIHVIVRNRMSKAEAYEVEAALIDSLLFLGHDLKNAVSGHGFTDRGLMSSDDIIRRNAAEQLLHLENSAVIININGHPPRGMTDDDIYNAVRVEWVIGLPRQRHAKFVLAEYRGLIIGVYEVENWYFVREYLTQNEGKKSRLMRRYGFKRKPVCDPVTHARYINKSIAHAKLKGQSNPVRYKL